jgi:diguanylate cyclase (GGDEF)-like protein
MTTSNDSRVSVCGTSQAPLEPRPRSTGILTAVGAGVVLLTASLVVGALDAPSSATLVAVLDALAVACLAGGLFAWMLAARSARLKPADPSGEVATVVAGAQSRIKTAMDGEHGLMSLLELSCDWYWEMDESLRFTAVQSTHRGKLTLKDEEVLGRRLWELEGELIRPATWAEHQAVLESRQPFHDLTVRRWHPSGGAVYHASSGDPVFDSSGRFRGYRGVGKDITDQIRSQEWIERLATFDALTRLPNRQAFDERAQRLLSNAYAEGQACAMLYIDLDDFRLLNNGYGHRIGDQVLAMVAERMRSVVLEPSLLGRRGGDELVALLVDVPRREVAVETAHQLIEAISQPARVFGMEVTVTASVGIAFFPQDGVDLDSLLNAADAAMYQAKEGGRRTHAFFTPAVARRVDLRLRLEQRLRRAFEARDFRLFYQPLVSLTDGRLVGAEALLRWKDVELGDIPPSEFIPIAEESGLIVGVGDWVLREACRQLHIWRQIGLDVPPIAVNMSAVQLRQIGCVESVLGVLQQYGMLTSDIEIEVTEHGLLDTSTVPQENLESLRNAGVKIALDDFGIGLSSLARLRDLPISRLKIDRSFTVECMRNARTLTIVKAVIEMARSLGLSVTAEGIETQAQQTWMQHLGCDSAQGYLLARPMGAEDFLKILCDRSEAGREKSLMR